MRVIVKQIDEVLDGQMSCPGYPLPPQKIDVESGTKKDDDFEQSGQYQFNRKFVHDVTNEGEALEYDISVKWP